MTRLADDPLPPSTLIVESIRTIQRALELGVTHIDTAEIYGPYANEELVGRALKGRLDDRSTYAGRAQHRCEGRRNRLCYALFGDVFAPVDPTVSIFSVCPRKRGASTKTIEMIRCHPVEYSMTGFEWSSSEEKLRKLRQTL